jgi:hypothetical protein
VLLALAIGLWGLIVWYVVAVIGFADPEQQRRELAGAGGGSSGAPAAVAGAKDGKQGREEGERGKKQQ